ncbi:MAG: serine/threonine protein kinase [Deltaproteobacteria bacterium]|nr:serine/threonine protein kinase [Deltaproteobacteria bacterium]
MQATRPPQPRNRSRTAGSPSLPALGRRLGNYRLDAVLGEGGQALVYLAQDVVLKRNAAVKVFKARTRNTSAPLTEARLIARMEHPDIVGVYHVETDEAVQYMAMEYVPGGNLAQRIRRLGPIVPTEALGLLRRATQALSHAHGLGVVHRDIKPQNLLGLLDGQLKLANFGLAAVHRPRSGSTTAKALVGTPRYMAPEIWCGEEPGIAADIYSLGAVLLHMLTGRPPFWKVDSAEIAQAHARGTIDLPPHIPADVAQLVRCLMAKSKRQRPASAEQVLREIDRCAQQLDGGVADGATEAEQRFSRAYDSVFSIPPLRVTTDRLRSSIESGALLAVVSGSRLQLMPGLVARSLAGLDSVRPTARLVVEPKTRSFIYALADMLRVKRAGAPGSGSLVDAIVGALAPEPQPQRRRLVELEFHRKLAVEETHLLVALVEACIPRGLSIVMTCDGVGAQQVATVTERVPWQAHAEFVEVPELELEDGMAILRLWIRAQPMGIRPWSAMAAAKGAHLALTRLPDLPRLVHNAHRLAEANGMPIVTTWCLRGAEAHAGVVRGEAEIEPLWRRKPRAWPTRSELDSWGQLPAAQWFGTAEDVLR